jgi:hypothetical protein
VCANHRLPSVVKEFEKDSLDAGDDVCYFGAEARLESAIAGSKSHSKALLGAQPAWDPAHFNQLIKSHSSLRAQLNRARNKGVSVVEYTPPQAMSSRDLHDILKKWLSTRPASASFSRRARYTRLIDRPSNLRSQHRRVDSGFCCFVSDTCPQWMAG